MIDKTKLKGFNTKQIDAVTFPVDQDCLISAGAGSGKTRTLAEKVYQICINNEVDISKLLILTFTDNAAHSMREKIVERFKKDNKQDLAIQMAGAHIQTFDSFLMYLVKKYSIELGVASEISIGSNNIFDTKRKVLLDELFDSYYVDDVKKGKMFNLLQKISLATDEPLKKIVLDLDSKINALSIETKDRFLNHYDDYYLSDTFIESLYQLAAQDIRETIIKAIYKGYFIESHYDLYEEIGKNIDVDKRIQYFANYDVMFHDFDYNGLSFKDPYLYDAYVYLIKILSFDDHALVEEVIHFHEKTYCDVIPNVQYTGWKKSKTVTSADKEIRKVFAKLFHTESSLYHKYLFFSDIDKEKTKLLSFKNDIHFLFDIVHDLESKLFEYKTISNTYSFNDVRDLALKLFVDNRYLKEREEIKSTFDYICIDEYQDSDDVQEVVFDTLCSPKLDGTCAHIFCVGDSKQAIYGFKNSNVDLFINRRNKYLDNKNHTVISMNMNYRSGKPLLNDINYLFNFYMTLKNGGIEYINKEEQLVYDEDFNKYSLPYDNFGIKRIVSVSRKEYDGAKNKDMKKRWEALAIIDHIKKTVNKELIYDPDNSANPIRTALYSDFCILMRNKTDFELYQKLFHEYNIPINNKTTTDLKNSDAAIVIESLLNLICYRLGKNPVADVRHLFASVARSYIYTYSDQQIFDILSQGTNDDKYCLDYVLKDQIICDVDTFIEKHKGATFSEIFVDLLTDFNIISKLYKVGDVSNVIDNIDSLFSIVTTLESSREGIDSFVDLLANIKKYKLSLEGENILQIDDAVDMMTVHASKGLERKIIYLPICSNIESGGSNLDKPDYVFSKQFGILLPYYQFDVKKNDNNELVVSSDSYKLITRKMNDIFNQEGKREQDEHVRLYYVAFTRAQNTVYIVGDEPKKGDIGNDDTLYEILNMAPHMYVIDKDVYNYLSSDSKAAPYLEIYEKLKNAYFNIDTPKNKSLFKHKLAFDSIVEIYESEYKNVLQNKIKENIDNLTIILYLNLFTRFITDYDIGFEQEEKNRFYALGCYNYDTSDIDEIKTLIQQDDMNKDQELDDEESVNDIYDAIKQQTELFIKSIYEYESPLMSKDEIKKVPELFGNNYDAYNQFKRLFPLLLKYYLFKSSFGYTSYENKEYKDEVIVFDYKTMPGINYSKDIKIEDLKYDNSEIICPEIRKERASKQIYDNDEELDNKLKTGTLLHKIMELVDFTNPNLDFVQNECDKEIIQKVLNMQLFVDLKSLPKEDIYTEYSYYDHVLNSNGSIDLLFIKNNEYTIVDYKTKYIDDPEYERQLRIYERNVRDSFNLNDSVKCNLILVSLIDAKIKIIQ